MKTRTLSSTALVFSLVAAPAMADVFGEASVSLGLADVMSTEGSGYDENNGSFSFSGSVGTQFGSVIGWADINMLFTDNVAPFDGTAPLSNPGLSGAVGLHAGYAFSPEIYAGAFVGFSVSSGWGAGEAPETNHVGLLYGIEGQYDIGDFQVFGQLGMAEIENGEDTRFDGMFHSIGAAYNFGQFAVIGELYSGESPDNYEDFGDWGEYSGMSLTVEYGVSETLTAFASASGYDFTANTEDNGSVNRFEVGVRYVFGDRPAGNRLGSPIQPAMGAGWAAALD